MLSFFVKVLTHRGSTCRLALGEMRNLGAPSRPCVRRAIPKTSTRPARPRPAASRRAAEVVAPAVAVLSLALVVQLPLAAQEPTSTPPLAVEPSDGIEPVLLVDPLTVQAGDAVTVNGMGWQAGISVAVSFTGDRPLGEAMPSRSGSFQIQLPLPRVEPGGYEITATQDLRIPNGHSSLSKTVPITVVEPSARLRPRTANVGDTLKITGAGWRAREGTVSIYLDGERRQGRLPVATFPIGEDGSFSGSVTVPELPFGRHFVEVCQLCGNEEPDDTLPRVALLRTSEPPPLVPLPFSVTPSLVLRPESGRVEQEVRASGSGWDVRAGRVRLFFDESDLTSEIPPVAKVRVNKRGSFEARFRVPARFAGEHRFMACQQCGRRSDLLVTRRFALVRPAIRLDRPEARADDTVSVIGSGWDAGLGEVRIEIETTNGGSAVPLASVLPMQDGTFSAGIRIPGSARLGIARVIACQRCAAPRAVTATASIDVVPRAVPKGLVNAIGALIVLAFAVVGRAAIRYLIPKAAARWRRRRRARRERVHADVAERKTRAELTRMESGSIDHAVALVAQVEPGTNELEEATKP